MPSQEPNVRNKNFLKRSRSAIPRSMALDEAAPLPATARTSPASPAARCRSTSRNSSQRSPKRTMRAPIEVIHEHLLAARCLRPRLPAGDAVRVASACAASRASRSASAASSALSPTGMRCQCPGSTPPSPQSNGHKVAVIGSGPSGPDLRGRSCQEGLRGHRSLRRSTSPAACWSTVSPSSVCRRPSCRRRSTSLKALGVKVETEHGHRQGRCPSTSC